MRENEMIVRERDTKHGAGEHHHDDALHCDRLFRFYHECLSLGTRVTPIADPGATHKVLRQRGGINSASIGDYRRRDAYRRRRRREDADALRVDALR